MSKVLIDKDYLDKLKEDLKKYNIMFDENTVLVFDNHMITFMERIKDDELIDSSKEEYEMILPELSELSIQLATDISNELSDSYNVTPTMMEIILVATHLQANTRKKKEDQMEEKKIVVVIGDRMGKGGKVASGIEKAGGKAILIEGMGADLKVGDVMHETNADFGISFCGSGGAGAIIASNKYGYKAIHHLRSIESGTTAIKNGYKVLGFGFMDREELGTRLMDEYKKRSEL